MIIKVISSQHPGNYYIEDTKNLTEEQLKKHLEYLKRNKQAKLLDYKIIKPIVYCRKTKFKGDVK